jgi:hypothetical protein
MSTNSLKAAISAVTVVAIAIGSSAPSAQAQGIKLPPPDRDGWIRLFRGDNLSDFYGRTATDINKDLAFPNGTFKARGDTIETTGSPTGHLAFKQVFSHYQFRMEIMLPAQTNCGLLLHVREDEDKMGNFPRSVEFQGDPNQGMGELWVISGINVDVKVKAGATTHTYDPMGAKVSHPSSGSGRVCHQSENKFKGYGEWNLFEALVRGSDSISHFVNGTRVMHYTNLRIRNDLKNPLNSGRIAVQSEGKTAFYRNLAIRLLPGDPLYGTTYAAQRENSTLRPLASRRTLVFKEGILTLQPASGRPWKGAIDLQGRMQHEKTPSR